MELKNIGILINQKKFYEAKAGLLELINSKIKFINDLHYPENIYENIYFTLSQVCIRLNELKESKEYLIKHLEIKPKDCEALLSLANLQLRTRDIENTEKIYKRILSINKHYLPGIVNLAIFYEGIGKIDSAIKYYEIAKDLEPNNLNFYYSLIRISPDYLNDERMNFIKDIVKKDKILKKDKFLAKLILSENYEKKKDHLNEIKFLELSHKEFLEHNADKKSKEYWLDIIPYYCKRFTYKRTSKSILKDIKPIFIIGLPRSGSTITELILSTSNTSKSIFGESGLINFSLISNYSEQLFYKPKNNKIEVDIDLIEKKILLNLKNFNISNFNKFVFIDKSLENFFYIDLIIKIFPKAKFVITERNIVDNIIGIYKKVLLNVPWAHSMSEIIEYINNYKDIINIYKKKYSNSLTSIKLEDLQNFNIKKVENLFNFCDLEFNDKYFEFQKKNIFIDNASNIQIRNKLYKLEYNKYKKYHHLLNNYENKYSWIKF